MKPTDYYDTASKRAREASQRHERHRAYKDAALWFACAAVLLWAVKFIVERGVV